MKPVVEINPEYKKIFQKIIERIDKEKFQNQHNL